jgi:hypothetical protein
MDKIYANNRYHRVRKEALDYLGNRCIKCGAEESLEIDHILPSTKEYDIADMWSWGKEKFLKELSKCQLLCKPHHIEKTLQDNGLIRVTHGSAGMYSNYKCRCLSCKDAHSSRMQEYRQRRILRDGVGWRKS